jgi:hypothetical protein
MNEKIEKIKKQFEDQTSTVENIRRLFDEGVYLLKNDIEHLKDVGSIDSSDAQVNEQRLLEE